MSENGEHPHRVKGNIGLGPWFLRATGYAVGLDRKRPLFNLESFND